MKNCDAKRFNIINDFVARISGDIQMLILYQLADSDADHRVSRRDLCDRLHVKDRVLRQEIAEMRKRGVFIAGGTDRAGYFIPSSYDEYLRFEGNYTGRALTTMYTQSQMRKAAEELLLGQTKMEGLNDALRD